MLCFFGHLFSFVLRGFFQIFLILIMVGVSHMFQNEKFAAVELAKAGQGHKQIATQRGRRIIKKTTQKIWRQVTPEYLESLYQSMPRHMQAVVDAQRGHTRY